MLRIIYDSAITGHHSEYIDHLVTYIVDNEKLDEKFLFIVREDLQIKFPHIIAKSLKTDKIDWEFISNEKCDFLNALPLYKRSFIELSLVKSYATEFNVKEVILLYFNIFQLALIFKRTSFNIRGILFLQFYRMQKSTIGDKLKYYRKYFITKLFSYNSKIKAVFVLNDQKTIEFLNRKFNTSKFKMLLDPIPLYNEEKDFDVYDYYNISRDKKILLHPGAIDPRKGTYEIIEAIDLLKEKETKEFAILIVGAAKPVIEGRILKILAELKNINFCITFDNTFVSNERLKSLFLQSYAVLMPYKNPEASSGILGHAAMAGKWVIVPNAGLIGEIVKSYQLGVLIEKPFPACIAKGIEELSNYNERDKSLSAKFVSNHTVENFSSSLMN